jgi:hypothetical protein
VPGKGRELDYETRILVSTLWNVETLFPMLRPRTLQIGVSSINSNAHNTVPLNFLSGIMDSSNFSSSATTTFLLFPSPITTRVFPQEKSSMHQNEYMGRKNE